MNAVDLSAVSKAFGKTLAVRDLDLSVRAGSIFGLIGPNGSGKTTTMRMILNILYPDTGSIRLFEAERKGSRLSDVGYLPEERGLYRKMKVRELLVFFAELRTGRRETSDVDRWLHAFELASWSNATIESLSKGMSQKVQFIASVVCRPRLVVMDEPFSGLDPVNFEIMKSTVLELKAEGTTIILSTHDMAVAENLCDSLCMIHQGRKVLEGSPQEIRHAHGSPVIRLQTERGSLPDSSLPHVKEIRAVGPALELELDPGADPQLVLQHLAGTVRIERFELARPSLHEIFVRIVRQTAENGDA